MAAYDPFLPLSFIVLAFLVVATEHIVRFRNETLRFSDAFAQTILARFDLGGLLLSPRGALFGIRHPARTIAR